MFRDLKKNLFIKENKAECLLTITTGQLSAPFINVFPIIMYLYYSNFLAVMVDVYRGFLHFSQACQTIAILWSRPVARLDFRGCRTPESGPFGPNPPHKTPFLAHFVAKSGYLGWLRACYGGFMRYDNISVVDC